MSGFNRVITPCDVMSGREDEKVLADGTCGKGLYPTFKRHQSAKRTQFISMFLSTNLTLIYLGNMKQIPMRGIKVSSKLVYWKQH